MKLKEDSPIGPFTTASNGWEKESQLLIAENINDEHNLENQLKCFSFYMKVANPVDRVERKSQSKLENRRVLLIEEI